MKQKLFYFLSTLMVVLLFTSCEDEQYQKYDDIKFDSQLIGSWVKKHDTFSKSYQPLYEIKGDQSGVYYEIKLNESKEQYLNETIVKYRLTKGNVLIAHRQNENHAIYIGEVILVNSDSIVLARELFNPTTRDTLTHYNPNYLESIGFKLVE